ncbi:transcription termination/antitermination NusG family protein [Mycoplasma sp. ATU-Cv-508]|uniref:transcription termination/antitermination NusG family protein n=1 Tax=Mycoplasma sp. ATU-Cv-508 TaxID=2048001 RepID=UPI0031F2E674
MGNEAWFLVRNTEYVTGLVGSSGQRTKPTPVSNLEMRKMIKRVEKNSPRFWCRYRAH